MQCQTVQPLLEAMRAVDVKYHWGFPFLIIAGRNGKTAVPQTKDALQHFLEMLHLPLVDFPDWRLNNTKPLLQRPEQWHNKSQLEVEGRPI